MTSTIPPPETIPPPRQKPSWRSLLRQNPLLWKASLCLTAGTIAVGVAVVVTVSVTRSSEPETLEVTLPRPQLPVRDPQWLSDAHYCAPDSGRTLLDCYVQMQLWANYALSMVQGAEAMRYRSKASEFMSLKPTEGKKTEACYEKPEQVCLSSFAQSIIAWLQAAQKKSESERQAALAGGLMKYLALSEARIGTPQASVAPIDALLLRIPEKFESDLALYYGSEPINNEALRQFDPYRYRVNAPQKP